jgi:hypothetical protein
MQTSSDGLESIKAVSDLSAARGKTVKLSTNDATIVTAAADVPYGVVVEEAANAGEATIALCAAHGECKVLLSGTVAKGAYLQQTAAADAVTDAGTGTRVLFAQALESGVTGEWIRARLMRPESIAGA